MFILLKPKNWWASYKILKHFLISLFQNKPNLILLGIILYGFIFALYNKVIDKYFNTLWVMRFNKLILVRSHDCQVPDKNKLKWFLRELTEKLNGVFVCYIQS